MNKYELYNEMTVEIEEDDIYDFNDIDKMKMKKGINTMFNKKNRTQSHTSMKNHKKMIAASVICIASIGATPVAASYLFGDLSTELNVSRDLANYSTVVGQSVVYDGTSITIDEVILDNNTLTVLSTLQSSKTFDDSIEHFSATAYINGVQCNGGSGSTQILDDYTRRNLFHYNMADSTIDPDSIVDIKIEYQKYPVNGAVVDSNVWEFEFTTDAHSLAKDTKFYDINEQFVLDDGTTIEVSHLTHNAAGTKIYFDYISKRGSYTFDFVGYDNLGNEIWPGVGAYSIYDGGYSNLQTKITNPDGSIYFGGIDENATSITLQLTATEIPEESGRLPEPCFYSNEFIIELR
ncbi:MAG: hypothetical protein BEN18_05435 [Epulopiscium sp. Nuni2H_MBin001]|nr:MAG: hypothetical protein BEN18_05435 [Epulopiscium sp. Nuni2H_MBin001]